jgi:hypothetical protein
MNWTMRWVGVCLLFSLDWGVAGTRAQQRPVAAEPQAPSRTAQAPSELVPTLAVPRLIRFAGTLKDAQGKPLSNTVGLTFAIYKDQEGGAALWLETQNTQLDEQGHYSVLLGATKSEGLPLELFSSGEPRWLGILVQSPGEVEAPRVLLVSVPYALKAADADTLGGIPASAFVLAAPTDTASGTGVSGSTTETSGNSKTPEKTVPSGRAETAGAAALIATVAGRVYVPITPCRIVDTRIAGGPIAGGSTRNFLVTGANLSLQGGSATGCGVPFGPATAAVVNFVVVAPAGAGDLRQTPFGTPVPLASFLNYVNSGISNDNTSNGLVMTICNPAATTCTFDFTIQVDGNTTDLVADVQGYFSDFAPGQVVRSLSGQTDNVTLNGTNGLSISASSGTVTLGIANGGVTNAMLANSSVTVNAGTGLTGGGPVALGGSLTLSNIGVLSFNGRPGLVTPTAGDYSFSQISGAATTAQLPAASLVRAITYLAGCDSCSTLTTADSQNTIFLNVIGGMTINSITCFSDAGAPTVNIQRNQAGTLTSILSANLTCSPTGATSSSFSTSALSLNDSLNFVIATADGVAKRVTVIIKATVN